MRVHVVVPVYNRGDLLRLCLGSIACQDDTDFTVSVSDDGSTDPAVAEVMDGYLGRDGWWLSHCTENRGTVANLVETIRGVDMDPDDVVLLVDGDDRLPHPGVIGHIRAQYEGTDLLVAYGSYRADPPNPGCPAVRPYPARVLRSGSIRAFTAQRGVWFNHPLSFRRRAFDALDDTDFTIDGEWMRYSYDVAFMMPLIEVAGTRVRYDPEVLYVYTSDRPDSDWCANGDGVRATSQHVIRQRRKYLPLEWTT